MILPPANLPAAPLMELTPPLLQLATQALDLVLDFNRPADAVLSAFFREHKKLGSHDRAFVAEAVFGVLRRYRYLSVVVPAANPRTLIIACAVSLASAGRTTRRLGIRRNDINCSIG